MLKGVLLDLGGTLYSYARLAETNRAILRTLATELVLDHPPESIERAHREASVHADRRYADRDFYLYSEYFRTIFESMLERLGRPELAGHFEWFGEFQRVNLITGMSLKPDCHETLAFLKELGLYVSVVSNADENMLRPLIARADIARYLDHSTSSEAARSCKPDRRFFDMALAKAGLGADEVLFVGDSLEQDIAGAKRVGMRAALISEFGEPPPMHVGGIDAEPDFRITRLSELRPIVDRLRRNHA